MYICNRFFLSAAVAVREVGPEEVKLKQVFMITLAHPVQALNAEGIVLVAPGVFSCKVIAEKVRHAFARPVYNAASLRFHPLLLFLCPYSCYM